MTFFEKNFLHSARRPLFGIFFNVFNIWGNPHYVWLSQFWSHFHVTMHCLPQGLKSTFFEIFSSGGSPKGTWSEENFQKTLILVFELIVQQPKVFFFSSLCDAKFWYISYTYSIHICTVFLLYAGSSVVSAICYWPIAYCILNLKRLFFDHHENINSNWKLKKKPR